MSNNNKQPLDLTDSLLVSDKAQAPSTTIPTVNKLDYDGISLVERRSRDVKPWEENDSLGISEINQPAVNTRNLTHSDELTVGFLLDCATRGKNRGNQSPSICKVSKILRDHSESPFDPQLVSIGPIHRDDPKLQEFEWLKGCYLHDLLNRCYSTPKETLEACVQKVMTKIPQIRESYDGVKKNYSDSELARMMVMDGCFILEFCFKHEEADEYLQNKMQNTRIAMDLMLLENQVPFVVLQVLFYCLAPYVPCMRSVTLSQVLDKYLAPYIKLFWSPEKISTTDDVDSYLTPAHDHVLGYLHKRYQLVAAKSSNPTDAEELRLVDEKGMKDTYTTFHSIVELDRSGMKLKPHQESDWSMTIKFQFSLFASLPWFLSKPTLLMPTLVIDDFTELILWNFIAYEQSFPQGRYHFTAYVHAMNMLIHTKEDIAKLVESKVLVNYLGSNQEAADMINKICKNVVLTAFYYTEEFKQMDKYYNGFWPKNIAKLRRIYFSNPWSAIALFVGIIVFLATVVSAIFAVLDYFR